MLLLTDGTEEGRDAPLQIAAQDEVVLDDGAAITGVNFQGQGRLVAGGQLGTAGETATLKVANDEVVVALLQKDKFLAIIFDGIVPIENSVVVVVHDKILQSLRTGAD